jgi:ubiquinone/menaquinone biosynthesis C-methylase UbiE
MAVTLDDVRSFWDKNPLLSGEIDEPIGTKTWFDEFDRIKTNDVFLNDLTQWIPQKLTNIRILDVGCGPGYWNRIFGKKNLEYHGIDISPKTVGLANKSKQIYELNGSIKTGNAEQLEFPDDYFDFVISEGVIHHTPNTQKCINEIYRVLSKNGTARVGLYYKNIFTRIRPLFYIGLFLMKVFRLGLKGRGREKIPFASNPEEFIRMYDGYDNPIGKAYSKKELKKMFRQFSKIKLSLYYFPTRTIPIKLPRWLREFLSSTIGFMILIQLKK